MNKYHQMLNSILEKGKQQNNKKGGIRYLLNQEITLKPIDMLEIFEGHAVARNKLRGELDLFMQGERNAEKYREIGITCSKYVVLYWSIQDHIF